MKAGLGRLTPRQAVKASAVLSPGAGGKHRCGYEPRGVPQASGTRARRRSRSLARRATLRAADLRHPAPRRPPAPLRLPPRARRRPRLVGSAEGRAARAGRAVARRPRRGPPARVRDLPRRDPEGPVRRRHGRDLGQRHVRAAGGEAERPAHRTSPRDTSERTLDARPGPPGREGGELAPDQGPRRGRGRRRPGGVPADARDARRSTSRTATAGRSRSSSTATARSRTSAAASASSSRGTATT